MALAITSLNSLTAGAYAGSAAVDNSTTLAEDELVSVVIATGSGAGTNGTCTVYAYGTTDGTNYTDGVSGADAVQTPPSPTNLVPIGVVQTPAASTTYRGGPYSVARAFGGLMPRKWGIAVKNGTAGPLAASGHSADHQPYNEQIP